MNPADSSISYYYTLLPRPRTYEDPRRVVQLPKGLDWRYHPVRFPAVQVLLRIQPDNFVFLTNSSICSIRRFCLISIPEWVNDNYWACTSKNFGHRYYREIAKFHFQSKLLNCVYGIELFFDQWIQQIILISYAYRSIIITYF